jgi:DNA-binding NarL/FixJ family response regulator
MPIRVLIADDHAVFRSGLRALLDRESDLEVVGESGSGPETIALVETVDTDVLLLDISMPGMPGPNVAAAARELRPDLAIVVLTMHEDPHYVREMLSIGVRGFVLKKSTGTSVVEAIRGAYQGGHYIDPVLAGHVIAPYIAEPGARGSGRLGLLSQREQEICRLLALGHTHSEIGEALRLSRRTVDTHRRNISSKLGVKGRADLVRLAIEMGLIDLA